MLYLIIGVIRDSGVVIYQETFDHEADSSQLEIMASFLTAFQHFLTMFLKEGPKPMRRLEFDKYEITQTPFPDLPLDIITLSDKDDRKLIEKFHKKIIHELKDKLDAEILKFGDTAKSSRILQKNIPKILSQFQPDLMTKPLLEEQVKNLQQLWKK